MPVCQVIIQKLKSLRRIKMKIKNTTKLKSVIALAVCLIILPAVFANSQYAELPGKKKEKGSKIRTIPKVSDNSPLSRTEMNIQHTAEEQEIRDQMIRQKLNDSGNPDEITRLQRELESLNGSTSTVPSGESFCRMLPPDGRLYPNSTDIYNGVYVAGTSVQIEQRGTSAGRIWVAVGVTGADTGAGASPDTLILYYSDNDGDSYTQYVKTVFSSANKINFDDLDMEIIEPASGDKYIYMVFGYTTNGYFGQNLIGYTIVRTPSLAVFGSTLFPPGYNISNRYLRPRISSDNTRYASVPYAFITYVQDSTDGVNTYTMSKNCWILSPYTMNPALTYIAQPLFTIPGSSLYGGMCTDVAYFHNGGDSLIYCLSEAPGYIQDIYTYVAFSNTAANPVFDNQLTPTGNELHHARIAANGGTNQKKVAIIYSENYNNSGDWDQYVLRTADRINWVSENFEFSGIYNSRLGNIIGRRNSDGSFAMAFKNIVGNIENVNYATYTGNFTISNYTHRANPDYSNSICSPQPGFRYKDGDSCFYNWNYFYTARSSHECYDNSIFIRYAVEGFYDDVNDVHNVIDVMYVILADANPPHNFIDTSVMYLDNLNLINEAAFYNSPPGQYYIVLKHYNALQTWSSVPVTIGDSPGFYDFTASDGAAYGNNMTLKGAKWCIFSGDVDQDETIDGTDLQEIDNDALAFVFGQLLRTDLNGDQFVDGGDYIIADNNAANFVSVIKP